MDPIVIASVLACGSAFLSIVIKTIQLKRLVDQNKHK